LTLANFIESIRDLPKLAEPGEVWSYNNAGFNVAGRVIEVVTGQSIHDAFRTLVFEPIGLTRAFTQMEGLVVGEGVSLADLKGTLTAFVQDMFTPSSRLRFRPSFFPYTEPSAEVDISCWQCDGAGCAICKRTGWIEILGCGMVHPAVFEAVGYDAERYTGFAWGVGIERVAFLRYQMDDMRMFFENDLRFLEQFPY